MKIRIVLLIIATLPILIHDIWHLDDWLFGWGRDLMAWADLLFLPGPFLYGHALVGLFHYLLLAVALSFLWMPKRFKS